jgi:hypothetical protein
VLFQSQVVIDYPNKVIGWRVPPRGALEQHHQQQQEQQQQSG